MVLMKPDMSTPEPCYSAKCLDGAACVLSAVAHSDG